LRRVGPERFGQVVRDAVAGAAPDTLLARVQAVWPEVAGAAIAAESAAASEHAGTITVHCSGAVWAQELALLESDLRDRLNGRLEGLQVHSLRFIVKTP
jgi:predicted nucleic acid-binding Zn ribbon protein